MWAVQGKKKRNKTGWQTCFLWNDADRKYPCVFYSEQDALDDMKGWEGADWEYRVVKVEILEIF